MAEGSPGKARSKVSTVVEVEIYGTTYPMRGEHDQDYLRRLAEVVDRKMREIGGKVPTVDTSKIAILAALNLADELARCNDKQEGERTRIMEKVTELTGEITEALEASA